MSTYFQDDNATGDASMGGGYGQSAGFGSRPPRQMYDVSAMGLKCASCGTDIKELPFPNPSADRPVYCRDCKRASAPRSGGFGMGGGSRGGSFGSRPPRQMYDVSAMGLKCASCGTDIKELPFPSPSADRPVYCRDCNRQRATSRF